MNAHKFFKLLLAFVFAFSLRGTPAPVLAQEPNPHIEAPMDGHWLHARDWPLGTLVTLAIDRPSTSQSPDYTTSLVAEPASWNPDITVAEFDLNGIYPFQIGDLITMSGGGITKTLTIANVIVTSIDASAGKISGIAEAGAEIEVSIGNQNAPYRRAVANESGHWTVDFSTPWSDQGTFELTPNLHGGATLYDSDGDFISDGWTTYPPTIQANIGDGKLNTWNWPHGALLTMTISKGNNIIYSKQNPVGYIDWAGYIGYFELPHALNLQAGDLITITDGIITKSYVIAPIWVTKIDVDADTVEGTATPFSNVEVHTDTTITGGGCCAGRLVTADASGNWVADFHDPLAAPPGSLYPTADLVPGSPGQAVEYDDEGNSTWMNWVAPNPHIEVNTMSQSILAREWQQGTILTLTIDNPSNGTGLDYTGMAIAEKIENPGDVYIQANFTWPDMGLQPGYIVKVSGNGTEKILIISLLVVDVQTDTISGTTSPGANIEICVNIPNNCIHRYVTADSSGNWLADYHTPGTQPDEQQTVDLKAGSNGWAAEKDQDGDQIRFDWRVPNPSIGVHANDDKVEGWEWTPNTTVTITVDDPNTPEIDPDITRFANVYEAPWNPGKFRFDLDLKGVIDIQPGFELTASDGNITKTHIVTSLAFTGIDVDTDIVTGTAAAGSQVNIWVCDNSNCYDSPTVIVDGDGEWSADFTNIHNIVRGSWVDSSQRDDDGDQTYWGERLPNPYVEASPNSNSVHAREWPKDTEITLTISGSSETYTAMMAQAPWNPGDPNDIVADFDLQGYDIQAGDVITASASGITKTLTVSQLEVTDFDLDADAVSGVGTPGVQIQACANIPNRCITRWVTPNGSGNWTANYHDPGTGNDDPDTFDVVPGSNGWVAERDQDGDQTWLDWRVPTPMICVNLNHDHQDDSIWSMGWPLNAIVNLNIYDPGTPQNPDYTSTQTGELAWWEPTTTFALFILGGVFEIQPGYFVSVNDGTSIKTMDADLSVSHIDISADTVSGTAGPGTQVNVTAGDASRHVEANMAGDWIADFAHVQGDEQTTFDIVPGTTVMADQWDEDGDCINYRRRAPDNQPPVITNITAPVNPVQLGQSINATVTFSDPDVGDTHTVTWDWGDGATTTASASVLSVTTPHTYASPGVYTITATVTDAAGASALAAYQFVVIYDPNGGYVTGGGWIMSPAGAYFANPTLTGKATFGFVSKYQKGADVPTGNTEFQFQIANLNFKSTSYDWLVIAGKKAQYKGTGTINGSGNYGFMLTAIDDTLDKFRIKIWDKANGDLVYDNQLGAADTADPVTVIGGGSIVIHKEK